jgi:hypothetical protein
LVLKLKILDLKLPFYPGFTSVFSKFVQQFKNRFNRFLHCSPLSLPVYQSVVSEKVMVRFLENRFNRILNPVQPNLKRLNRILNPVQPNLKPVESNLKPVQPNLSLVQSLAESASEPKTDWWNPVQPNLKPVQPNFSQISPTTTSFWEHLYIHLPHSSPQNSTHKTSFPT